MIILTTPLLVVFGVNDDDPKDDFNEYIQPKHTNRGSFGFSPKDKRLIDNHLDAFPSGRFCQALEFYVMAITWTSHGDTKKHFGKAELFCFRHIFRQDLYTVREVVIKIKI